MRSIIIKYSSEIKLIGLVALFIGIDQFFKYLIRHLGGFYICNSGIAFGIKIPETIFWIFAGLFFLAIIYFLKNGKYRRTKVFGIGTSLIFAGALSNIIDRMAFGCIIDFIDIKIFNYPLFNFADVFIFIGVIILLVNWDIKHRA